MGPATHAFWPKKQNVGRSLLRHQACDNSGCWSEGGKVSSSDWRQMGRFIGICWWADGCWPMVFVKGPSPWARDHDYFSVGGVPTESLVFVGCCAAAAAAECFWGLKDQRAVTWNSRGMLALLGVKRQTTGDGLLQFFEIHLTSNLGYESDL